MSEELEIAETNAASDDALGGAQRAAALLLAMDRTNAQAILRHFSPGELREVTIAAARLGSLTNSTLEGLVGRFERDFADASWLHGDEANARDLVAGAITPELISTYLESAHNEGPVDVWKGLSELSEKFLVDFLSGEHPLIVTCILSRLESQMTSRIVSALPRDLRNSTLVRLMSPPPIAPEALEAVERALRHVLLGGVQSGGSADEARTRIAEIINGLDPSEADDVMKALEAARPQDARAVRSMLFSFLDLPRLSQRSRAQLFDKISTDLVVLALRGTDAEFRESALSAMAARSRRLVEGELASASAPKPSDVAKARKDIVKVALAMAQKGEIELPSNDIHDGMAAA